MTLLAWAKFRASRIHKSLPNRLFFVVYGGLTFVLLEGSYAVGIRWRDEYLGQGVGRMADCILNWKFFQTIPSCKIRSIFKIKRHMNRTLMLVLLIIVSNLLCAKNYHVQPLGSDNNDGLSFAKAFKKPFKKRLTWLLPAIASSAYDGFYKGWDHFYKNSGVQSNLIVYFAKGQNVIINQSCGRGFDGLNIEGCDWIEVNGFRVQSIADPNGSGEDGIRAVLSNHIIIHPCIVDSCYRGILQAIPDDFLAENNICKKIFGEHGIYVSNNSDKWPSDLMYVMETKPLVFNSILM